MHLKPLLSKSLLLFVLFLISFTVNAQFRVIGYYPTWINYPSGITSVDLSKLTHVNIAFANPNSSGTPVPADGTNADVTTIVNACHAKGVKVFLSIGGAGAPGATYKTLLSSTASTQSFVSKLTQYAITYNLDGIDVDIEGDVLGVKVTKAQYQSFVTYLADSLHAQGKLMSAALATWFGNYVTTTAASQFDWINIMSYDASIPPSGPPAPHAPYSMMLTDFQYWNSTKGIPGSKINIGLPFYGYGWGTYANANNDEISYCTIASTYSGAANTDSVGTSASGNVIYYNGIPTIKQKTDYAIQNAGGVMIWELTEDCPTTNSNSLLLTIYDEVYPTTATKPTITFNTITKTYGNASFTASATSNSSGAITYSIISGSSYASITSGGTVTIKGAGTATIQAIQAAATGYSADTVTATLTINKAALTATADNKTKVYNTANPALTITYSGFVNSETLSVLTSAPTASTTASTSSNVGSYPITLSGGSAANYTITLVNGSLSVTQATPTLTYTGSTTGMSGSSIGLSATSTSGGTISYTVTNGTGTATVSGSSLNLTGVGTVTLTVKTAATTNYKAASITQSITITAPPKPTITFNTITKAYGSASFTASATSNSSGAITYSIISGSSYASITSGGTVTIKGAGTATIQAIQAAATGYSADTVTATLTINKAALTATADNKTKVYNTANPALTITYSGFVNGETSSVLTSAPTASTTASTSSNVGSYPITLSGGSAANYTITLVNGSLSVTQATPTITYAGSTTGMSGSSIGLYATSTSGGTISYTVTNGTGTATVSGSLLDLTGVGTVTLTVNVAATTNYKAGSITQAISITTPPKPTFTLGTISKTYGDSSFTVSATSNSPGAITYSIISGGSYASITSGGTVTIKGAGTATLQAIQAAATGYSADTVTTTLSINKSPSPQTQMAFPDSGIVGDTITMSVLSNSTGAVTYAMMRGDTNAAAMTGKQLRLLSPGVFTIEIMIAGDSNFLPQLDTMQITILPASVTGMFAANASGRDIVIFPNPSNGEINIHTTSNEDVTLVTVINTQGKQEQYTSNYFRTLMKGLLILRVKTTKGEYTTKVVTE